MSMNKLIKSLYLSIIFSGIIYIILHYFSLLFIDALLLFVLLVVFLFLVFFSYFKITSPKYSKKEVIEKYNLPVEKEAILNTAPKYTREEIIAKYTLPVSNQESVPSQTKEVIIKNEVVVENIEEPVIVPSKEILIIEKSVSKKPKDIPKQNLSYRNYAQVFRSINQSIHEDKKVSSSDSEILTPSKKEVLEEDNLK